MFTDLIVTVISVVLFRISFHFMCKFLRGDFSVISDHQEDVSVISDHQEDVSEIFDYQKDFCELPDKQKDFIQLN